MAQPANLEEALAEFDAKTERAFAFYNRYDDMTEEGREQLRYARDYEREGVIAHWERRERTIAEAEIAAANMRKRHWSIACGMPE